MLKKSLYFIYTSIPFAVLLLLVAACQKANPPIASVPVKKDSISHLASNLLALVYKAHEKNIDILYKASLPKLPKAIYFYGNVELNALDYGSKKALQRLYQRIPIVFEDNEKPIKYLDLSNQNIYYLPEQFARLQQLQYLSLKNNHLQAIHPNLASCHQLRKIDLSSNALQYIPEGLQYLNQLHSIDLSDNLLTTLPLSMQQMIALRSLDLSNVHPAMALYNNQFKSIPAVVYRMPWLQKIFLEKLGLQKLSSKINNIDSLQVLSLNGNPLLNLEQLFRTLEQMPQLQALDISFLGRTELPVSVSKLKHLKVLLWHEESRMNEEYILNELKYRLPNTRIYYGKPGVHSPFLRGNSIATIVKSG